MKRAGVRWMLASAVLGLAGLCLCSRVAAVPGAAGQISGTKAAGGEQEEAAPVLMPVEDAWKEASNAATNLRGLIRLDVMVQDAAGDAVAGLGQEDFTVLDNGQREGIVAFRPSPAGAATGELSPDVSIVVLLDTLALPPKMATKERQQVVLFLRANQGRLPWPVTVYTFENSGFYLTAEASRDGNALADAVLADAKSHQLVLQTPVPAYSPQSEAALQRDSRLRQRNAEVSPLSTGLWALATIAEAGDRVPGRKVLLWVGPGLRDKGTGAYPDKAYETLAQDLDASVGSLVGSYTPPEVTEASARQAIFDSAYWLLTLLRQAGMTVDVFSVGERDWRRAYVNTVLLSDQQGNDREARWLRVLNAWKPYQDGLDGPEHAKQIDLYKKVLAVESGGRILADGNDIAQQMAECVRAADTYYTLTFDPAPAQHADELHALQVKIRLPGLTAETAREYYDEPYYHDPPYGGARPVTVAGLESLLLAANGGSEQQRVLTQLLLTERVTPSELARLRADVHGSKPQEALEMLADEAEFEPPPKNEALADPPPGAAQQQQMLGRVQKYLEKSIPRLPDFFAVRQAQRFASTAAFHELSIDIEAAPLHRTDIWKANVLYRQGGEVVLQKAHAVDVTRSPLQTYGTFGPLLELVQSTLEYAQRVSWGRWERGTTGTAAVFAFAVPETVSHGYAVIGCCVLDRAGNVQFRILPPYHGEVAIDPETGAILRIQVEADLAGFAAVEQSAVMVAYGPVMIGGHTYIVPQRSVSLVRARAAAILRDWNLSFRTWGPEQTSMEVFTFDHYRMFRSSVRMLPGFEPLGNEPH